MIVFAAIAPHPPIIVEGIGNSDDLVRVEKTITAMQELTKRLEASNPETIVIISPHAPLIPTSFGVNTADPLAGNLGSFGLNEELSFDNDNELTELIIGAGDPDDIPTESFTSYLDHGALVPLHFLVRNNQPALCHLAFTFLPLEKHLKYGQAVGTILNKHERRIAVIASGDLSHRLIKGAPAGYSPKGEVFDKKLIESLAEKETGEIISFDEDLIEEAGECGIRSFVILLGITGEYQRFDLLSYEGPFGVGYLTAQFQTS